jgi:outer membrane receptor protein involved in Fe transport
VSPLVHGRGVHRSSHLGRAGRGCTDNLTAIVSAHSGDPLPNAAKNSATLALHYNVAAPMLDGWTMRWNVNGNYRSSNYSRLLNTVPGAAPPFLISGFSVWNASIDLANGHGLDLSLYGQNLFDALGITGGIDPGEAGPPPTNVRSAHYFIGQPRTIGLRLGYKF